MDNNERKSVFFFRNLTRGLIWLAIIVAMFILAKHNVDRSLIDRFSPIFDKTGLILVIYSLSEMIVGIIPPEFFMIWSLRSGILNTYIFYIVLLTIISYLAGITAYFFGRYLHNTRLYKFLHERYLQKSEALLHKFGPYLIVVAALTPLPFSGVAMLVGAIHYPINRYVWFSLSRFLKFAVTAYIIWEANMI